LLEVCHLSGGADTALPNSLYAVAKNNLIAEVAECYYMPLQNKQMLVGSSFL